MTKGPTNKVIAGWETMRPGERIRALRESRGVSLGDFAQTLSVTVAQLSAWERCKDPIGVHHGAHAAAALGVYAADILGSET